MTVHVAGSVVKITNATEFHIMAFHILGVLSKLLRNDIYMIFPLTLEKFLEVPKIIFALNFNYTI